MDGGIGLWMGIWMSVWVDDSMLLGLMRELVV